MTPRPPSPWTRPIAFLLAAALALPPVQWCQYSWAQVTPECAVACQVGPQVADCAAASSCGAPVAFPECASDPSTACGGDVEARGCALASAGEPDGGSASRTGRAWCPGDPVGARPESPHDDGGASVAALPVAAVTLDAPESPSVARAPGETLAAPRAAPPRLPPVRGPPSA